MRRFLLLISCVLFFSTTTAYAKRYALIIGNSQYGNEIGNLRNPVNDAQDMSALLKKKGFTVSTLTNATQREMKSSITQFTQQLTEKGSMGLFFFAGHGIEVDGHNFLIPIGANIQSESDVPYEGVDSGRVMGGMEASGNNLNLIILDACRNNPYARSFRSASKGLARIDPPKGSLILYATSPGDVAADGVGRNGLFTQHLLQAIDQSHEPVEKVFKITANKVFNESSKKQLPWQSGVILGDFYFSKNKSKKADVNTKNNENIFWASIQDETQPSFFNSYLKQC
ncbi:MAG: caspase family protein [Methyloprofundus sp.]|nr:caspase family protein [Methyloprofundus sp.]